MREHQIGRTNRCNRNPCRQQKTRIGRCSRKVKYPGCSISKQAVRGKETNDNSRRGIIKEPINIITAQKNRLMILRAFEKLGLEFDKPSRHHTVREKVRQVSRRRTL